MNTSTVMSRLSMNMPIPTTTAITTMCMIPCRQGLTAIHTSIKRSGIAMPTCLTSTMATSTEA